MRRLALLALTAATLAACSDPDRPTGPDAHAPAPALRRSVVTYGITAIDGGDMSTYSSAINDLGQVAGYRGNITSFTAFLWANGAVQLLPSDGPTVASDVNQSGLVVGWIKRVASDRIFAAAWQNGALTKLGGTAGIATRAIAVNDAGQIVGVDDDVGLVWSGPGDGSPTRLQGIDGSATVPLDINNAGVIVGRSATATPFQQALIWTSASAAPRTLAGFGGGVCEGANSTAASINALGEIVGTCDIPGGGTRAAYWANKDALPIALPVGGAVNAGASLVASSINELGQVVGNAAGRPALWTPELGDFRVFDLGVLSDDVGGEAYSINNTGRATGLSRGRDKNSAVVWDVPMQATIDVVPGSATNAIKLDTHGTVSVAVLGSRWFRATDVSAASLTLGNDDGIETPVSMKKTTPVARVADVNRDGFPDLVADFDERALMSNGDLTAATTSLVLLGRTTSGAHLRGADVVRVTR